VIHLFGLLQRNSEFTDPDDRKAVITSKDECQLVIIQGSGFQSMFPQEF